ncbi:DUF2125 domain-containing protein [Pseudochrobactrum sp. sp1633]|uniref:DUF2125 domain-containing protein n=1 Tax=Pseudochrobactrum sp. sp1633 TaxID=3036706 RepID=UPI0025A51E22|nr:DUF2125 domain-containing protein [Pseudochrobactrum sp. sp1633]MDM8345083.1 DUF2125 domain-containing protein [Pseudochrobactrum sp. sp1633]HWD14916.1 DUF2125 domain-containing protein [Pseudochrobactrum sp.]
MVAKSRPSPQSSRRMTWGIIIALILVVLYTAGWFYLASMAKERVRTELASAAGQEETLDCQSLSARGYPFSLYVSCSGVNYRDKNQTFNIASSAVDVGASVFSFRTVQTQLTGPAAIALSGADPVKADWGKLTASVRMNGRSPQDISLTSENLLLQTVKTNNTEAAPALSLLGLQFDLNSVDEPLKIKMTFDDLRVTGDKALSALPELDGMLDITSPASLASFKEPDENGSVLRGKSLQLNQMLFLLPSGASVSISGPASVDSQGLANADLKIRLTNPAAIGTVLQAAFPDQAKNINTVVFALGSMPKDETGATIVPVIVKEGKISAGFIPLGRMPLL